MNLIEKLEEIKKQKEEFNQTHYFSQNSKEKFAISKSIVETNVKQLRFDDVNEEEAREILGQRWYVNCKRIINLYKFLAKSKYLYKQDNFAISMIACTLYKIILDNNEKRKFSSTRSIVRTLEDMKKMDMLRCVDKNYAKDLHKARSYVLSIPRIKSLCNLQRLQTTYGKSIEFDDIVNDVIYNVDNEVFDVDCNVDYNNNNNEELDKIRSCYHKLSLKEELQTVNANLKNIYKYKMTGWRPSAGICYIASKEKTALHKTMHEFYREDVISHDYEGLKEFDRNASIYNLMVFLGKGEIRENDRSKYDLYEHLNKGLQTLRTWENDNIKNDDTCRKIDGLSGKELKEELLKRVNTFNSMPSRQDVKNLIMTINFADMRQIRSLVEDSVNYMMNGADRYQKRAFKFFDRFVSVCKYIGLGELKDDLDYLKLSKNMISWFKDAKKLLQNFVGNFKIGDKSIFLYEAKVNLHCQSLLQKKGFDCVSVYDGFYTNADYDTWWDCYKESLKELKSII